MRTITIYNKDGTKTVIDKTKRYKETYDATIDKPFHQRVLDSYYAGECDGTLKDYHVEHSKKWTAELHKKALREGW